jgi:mannitol-1-/sugar-/sorbitol-6-phosphatase
MVVKSAAGFLFDMDGTLVDSSRAVQRIWSRFALRHGLDLAALMPIVHGVRAVDTVRRLALPGLDPEVEAAIIEGEEIEDVDGVVAIPGAPAFLAALPAERWTVVTSASRALARARLGAAHLPLPDTSVTGEQVLRGKPAPECFLLGAQRLGFEPAECLAFEDSAAGIQAATAAGADLVVVASRQARASPPGRFVVSDYGQLELTVTPDRLLLRPRVSARSATTA